MEQNAVRRLFRIRIQEIDGGGDRRIQITGHGRDILQNAVLLYGKEVGGIDRGIKERGADDLGGHIVVIENVQIIQLPAFLRRNIFEGSDRAQGLVIVREQEIALVAPVGTPAVLHDPYAVGGGPTVLRPAVRREGIIPADNRNRVIRGDRLKGILGIDHRVRADKGHIRFLVFIRDDLIIASAEGAGHQNSCQLIVIQGRKIIAVLRHVVHAQSKTDEVTQFVLREIRRIDKAGADINIPGLLFFGGHGDIFQILFQHFPFLFGGLLGHGLVRLEADADRTAGQKLGLDGLGGLGAVDIAALGVKGGGRREHVGVLQLEADGKAVFLRKTPVPALFGVPLAVDIGGILFLEDADAGGKARRGQEIIPAGIQRLGIRSLQEMKALPRL